MDELEYAKKFTQIYKDTSVNKYSKEATCNYLMHSQHRMKISKNDFYVSSFPDPVCGFGSRGSGFIYYCKIQQLEEFYNNAQGVKKQETKELLEFWKRENNLTRIRNEYPGRIKEMMPADDFNKGYNTSYPLYRFGGAYLDFYKLVKLGISGLIVEIKDALTNNDTIFLQGALEAMQYFRELLILYRNDAKKINKEIYQTIDAIIDNPPSTMRQAIQLIWLYVGVSEVRNYGRMDIVLADFAEQEVEDYQAILEYFKVIQQRNTIFNGRIILGGRDQKNSEKTDYISKIALRVMKNEHFTEPQLTLRCHKNMSKEVLSLAWKCIADGCSYPLLYNDDINIPSVMESFKVNEREANDYVPFGCGEYVLNHKSIGSPNGIINLMKVLEGILNHGRCMLTNTVITKYYIDNPVSFIEVLDTFKKELAYQIDVLAYQESYEYQFMDKQCGYIYNSILYDNCLSRGRSILDGGIDYLGGTLETYGNVNVSDSLLAIKKIVFDDKKITYKQMVTTLKNNYQDAWDIHELCLNVSKYGNDNKETDNFFNKLNQFVAITTKEKAIKYNLSSYLIVIINNQANSHLGFRTGASFDGRKAGEVLANALTPQAGAEKSGITAVLNSVSSLDVDNMAGAVYNLKLSKDIVKNHLETVEQLISVYFENGGSQIMISVIDQKELEDAMIHPERYPNLIVRVGGFSARFIDLEPLVQREIISRAMY